MDTVGTKVLWLTFLSRKVSWGFRPQTLTQRTFCKKPFGISKTFAKINGYGRYESSLAYLSPKER